MARNKKKKRTTKKRKTLKKRDLKKFPGLDGKLFSKIKQEYHDLDYIDSLNDKEKAWLSKFMEEYLGARLNHEGKKFHKSKKLRKDCFDKNNARNRDIYSISRALGSLDLKEEMPDTTSIDNPEDALIDLIDNIRKKVNT